MAARRRVPALPIDPATPSLRTCDQLNPSFPILSPKQLDFHKKNGSSASYHFFAR
jgi:hypothetical protein